MAVTPLVAIVGRPNVGKSSLFNRLIGARVAITHDTAGTTRNANYGQVDWRDRHFTLVDTAGLSKQDGEIELQAREQIHEMAESASVIVVAVDACAAPTTEDLTAARLALKTGKPVILALSKIDAAGNAELEAWRRLGVPRQIGVSAIHGTGTGDLLDAISENLPAVDAPDAQAPLKLALIGRPNVGKSSLLNNLVQKQKAITSSIPGTTRDIARESLKYKGREIELIDTAGLRRRGRIERGVEKFSALRTLAAINEADVCVLVMDAGEPSVAGDQHLAGQIVEAGRGLILAVNKWDAVEKTTGTQELLSRRIKKDFQFAWWAPLVFTSATQGANTNRLMELAVQIEERRAKSIPTPELNRLLEKVTANHPPAGMKHRRPKLNYITQTGSAPPAFTFFGSNTEFLHFGYKRHLENAVREQWDFTGTPIQLEFRAKH
jgi:GTP-binding protein